MNVARIGLDIAKLVFQVDGVDAHGKPVLKKTLKCLPISPRRRRA